MIHSPIVFAIDLVCCVCVCVGMGHGMERIDQMRELIEKNGAAQHSTDPHGTTQNTRTHKHKVQIYRIPIWSL